MTAERVIDNILGSFQPLILRFPKIFIARRKGVEQP